MRIVLLAFLIVATAACGLFEPRLNTSSDEAYARSLREMERGLTDEEKEDLRGALMALAIEEISPDPENPFATMNALSSLTPEQIRETIAEQANGRTAREIINSHYQRQLERTDLQIETLQNDLTENDALFEAARTQLSAINVSGARFYWGGRYIREPVIDFTVTNNGAVALSRIYFRGRVETPGRTIPWIDETFNYVAPGGIEPGESRRLQLSPNMFGEWGVQETQNRNDLVFTVTVEDFEGPNGERLLNFTAEEMNARREQLAQLRQSRDQLAERVQ